MFMEQAEALLGYGDYATAEQLAGEAARQRVEYAPFEPKPEDLIRRIGMARRSGDNPTLRPSPIEPISQSADTPAPSMAAKQKAIDLCKQARQAMEAGQLPLAESLARQAEQLRIPDAFFAPGQDRPGIVLLDIRMAGQRGASGMAAAGGQLVQHAAGTSPADHTASRALYDAANDPTRNLPAAYQQQPMTPGGSPAGGAQSNSVRQRRCRPRRKHCLRPCPRLRADQRTSAAATCRSFQQGETALKAHDTARAYEYFRQAAGGMDQLDPDTRQRLQGYLQLLSAPNRNKPATAGGSMVEETAAAQLALARQVAADVAIQEGRAMELRATDPKAALSLLEEDANTDRVGGPGTAKPRAVVASHRSGPGRNAAVHRAEPSPHRTGREEPANHRRDPARATAAVGQPGEARPDGRRVQQADG